MPDYEYEALDSSGKSVTGTSSHPNEAFARAKLEKLGLYPVRLAVIPSSIPKKKLWDGTFGDGAAWLGYGVALPIMGLFVGLTKFGELMPTIGSGTLFCLSFYLIRRRVTDGKWPESEGYG